MKMVHSKLQSYKATKLQSYKATKLQSYKATKLQSIKILTILMFGIFISQACKEVSKIDTVQKEPIKVEVTMQAEDFYNLNHEWLTQNFESLVQNASGLKQLIKVEQIQKNSVQNDGVIQIPVNKLKDKMEKKSTSSDEFEIFRVLTKE